MSWKLLYVLFMIIFYTSSCSSPSDRWQAMEKIVKQHAKHSKKSDSLKLTGLGDGTEEKKKYYQISIDYSAIGEVDVDEARRIYIRTLDRAINLMDSSESVRPFLTNYPSTPLNVDLTIEFYSQPYQDPPPGYVAIISMAKEKIIYKGAKDREFYDLLRETVEEAREKLRNELH